MNILFYDVETTGKANFKLAPDHKEQPRVVQLAALLCNEEGDELSCLNVIIKPRQFNIPKEASDIHGITNEIANQLGVPFVFAFSVFTSLARAADIHVGHNIGFDAFLVEGECIRASTEFPLKPGFCTMKQMTDICQLPGKYGWKWPRLNEAYRHCFNRELEGAHDAMVDLRATKEIYFWIQNHRKTANETERDQRPQTEGENP
jgi:DNA polymerase III subunit epsilon